MASAASAAGSCAAWRQSDPAFDLVLINDLTDAKTLGHLLKHDSVHGKFPGTVEVKRGGLVVNGDHVEDQPPRRIPAAHQVEGPRRRHRDRVDRPLRRQGRREQAPSRRREEGDHLGAREGARRHAVHGHQPRGLQAGRAPHHLERVVHDELPRAGREGPARAVRDHHRHHDDDPLVHERPARCSICRTRTCAAPAPPRCR